MDEAVSFLKGWFIRFLENRDLVRKSIMGIGNEEGPDFRVNYKDKAVSFSVVPDLDGNIFEKIGSNNTFGIATLNNPKNIKFIYINWKKFAGFESLILYFINPFSNTDKAWILCPHVHDKVCDKSSLETGLKAMAEMVEPISYERLSERLIPGKQEAGQ